MTKSMFCTMLFLIVAALQPSTMSAQTPGNIASTASQRCVDVASQTSSIENVAFIHQRFCRNVANQMFSFKVTNNAYQIVAMNSNKCIQVKDRGTSDGTKLVQNTCSNDDSMLWILSGSGRFTQIQSKLSGKCINLPNITGGDGVPFDIQACEPINNMFFRIRAQIPSLVPPLTTASTRSPTRSPTRSSTNLPMIAPTSTTFRLGFISTTRSPTRSPTKPPTRSPTRSPIKPPTRSPTKPPTRSPTRSPTKPPTRSPTRSPTKPPTRSPTSTNCICTSPRAIPTQCEVKTLIELMDIAVRGNHKLSPQWLRLSYHDAGTFNKAVPEGGANGCLITDGEMRNQPENLNLDIAIETLKAIRDNWEQLKSTCINISNADIIQFAGFFAAVRQTSNVPGITPDKIAQLSLFKWGRPDESNCNTEWTMNLPGFTFGAPGNDLAERCKVSGEEIKTKMMDRNGFTAEEATALIGAHTIGLTRNVFRGPLAAPWVENGADNATPTGPVFDNTYFTFMTNEITANTITAFISNPSPLTGMFPTWVRRDESPPLNFLDTDLVLAFPPTKSTDYPNYHTSTVAFSNNNQVFLDKFHRALSKMGILGVSARLSAPSPCSSCATFKDPISTFEVVKVVADLGAAVATADATETETQIANMDQQMAQITRITIM